MQNPPQHPQPFPGCQRSTSCANQQARKALYRQQAANRLADESDFATSMQKIGTKLFALRQQKGKTLAEVGLATRLSKSRLHQIEQGHYPHFDLLQLATLAAYYTIDPLDIIHSGH